MFEKDEKEKMEKMKEALKETDAPVDPAEGDELQEDMELGAFLDDDDFIDSTITGPIQEYNTEFKKLLDKRRLPTFIKRWSLVVIPAGSHGIAGENLRIDTLVLILDTETKSTLVPFIISDSSSYKTRPVNTVEGIEHLPVVNMRIYDPYFDQIIRTQTNRPDSILQDPIAVGKDIDRDMDNMMTLTSIALGASGVHSGLFKFPTVKKAIGGKLSKTPGALKMSIVLSDNQKVLKNTLDGDVTAHVNIKASVSSIGSKLQTENTSHSRVICDADVSPTYIYQPAAGMVAGQQQVYPPMTMVNTITSINPRHVVSLARYLTSVTLAAQSSTMAIIGTGRCFPPETISPIGLIVDLGTGNKAAIPIAEVKKNYPSIIANAFKPAVATAIRIRPGSATYSLNNIFLKAVTSPDTAIALCQLIDNAFGFDKGTAAKVSSLSDGSIKPCLSSEPLLTGVFPGKNNENLPLEIFDLPYLLTAGMDAKAFENWTSASAGRYDSDSTLGLKLGIINSLTNGAATITGEAYDVIINPNLLAAMTNGIVSCVGQIESNASAYSPQVSTLASYGSFGDMFLTPGSSHLGANLAGNQMHGFYSQVG